MIYDFVPFIPYAVCIGQMKINYFEIIFLLKKKIKKNWSNFTLSSKNTYTLINYIKRIEKIIKKKILINYYKKIKYAPKEMKFKPQYPKIPGWKTKVNLKDGILECFNTYKNDD